MDCVKIREKFPILDDCLGPEKNLPVTGGVHRENLFFGKSCHIINNWNAFQFYIPSDRTDKFIQIKYTMYTDDFQQFSRKCEKEKHVCMKKISCFFFFHHIIFNISSRQLKLLDAGSSNHPLSWVYTTPNRSINTHRATAC